MEKDTHPCRILLTTFNARYTHASLGLRYLLANMGTLQTETELMEFTLQLSAEDAAERLLEKQPSIIGFGVYLWNCELTLSTINIIKSVAPHITIVVGGPEVSHEQQDQLICERADFVISGAADVRFRELCMELLDTDPSRATVVSPHFLSAPPIPLDTLELPYAHYTDNDLQNRIIYVEASRGCPFKCEFCLSSLDKTAEPFPLDKLLDALQQLFTRGARHFKFVDRTFNLKIASCIRILDFFLALESDDLFLHFELIPDRLPDALKQRIARFPAAQIQFEIGIQSFNPEVQTLISRRQNMKKTVDNLSWLRHNSGAHIHADLIFGLPGETLDSFADGFNQLVSLDPHEVQVGLLKRLRGTPINRHTNAFSMRYQTQPPYRILQTSLIDYLTVQRMVRFARYWDLIGNSGRFKRVLPHVLDNDPFWNFLHLSDWLHRTTGQTHRIALTKLFVLLYQWVAQTGGNTSDCLEALRDDCRSAGFDVSILPAPSSIGSGSEHSGVEKSRRSTDPTKDRGGSVTDPLRHSTATAHTDRQQRHQRSGRRTTA